MRKGVYQIKNKLLDGLCDILRNTRSFNPAENILIFSYPRSGSTWLAELINTLSGTAMLWEPLHLRNVKEFRELDFGWRQHIPESAQWKEAEATFKRLFKGELLNFWLSSRESVLKFCVAERLIIKFVRANGMLPWLIKTFELKKEPLFLLRHPFAVAASQMKEGSWDDNFESYKIPKAPFNEVFNEHALFLSSLSTKQEAMVAGWCINNKIVLENKCHDRAWINLYYEDLLLNSEQELERVFDRWNEPMPKGILKKVSKASSTTKEATFQKDIEAHLSKWQAFFDREEIKQMQRVLNYFEIDVYSTDILPSDE